jgi:hypothetical protein
MADLKMDLVRKRPSLSVESSRGDHFLSGSRRQRLFNQKMGMQNDQEKTFRVKYLVNASK